MENLAKEILKIFERENMTYLESISFIDYLTNCLKRNALIKVLNK
jgi:hypothetical protein